MAHYETLNEMSKIYKALGEPVRIKVIRELLRVVELDCTVLGARIPEVATSTLSHHLRILLDCGLVQKRKNGTFHIYRINRELIQQFAPVLLQD